MLGLFLNLQDINFSSLPTSNSWTFDYNAELVKRAEELGFEIAFSRTQWLPKGGYDGNPRSTVSSRWAPWRRSRRAFC